MLNDYQRMCVNAKVQLWFNEACRPLSATVRDAARRDALKMVGAAEQFDAAELFDRIWQRECDEHQAQTHVLEDGGCTVETVTIGDGLDKQYPPSSLDRLRDELDGETATERDERRATRGL